MATGFDAHHAQFHNHDGIQAVGNSFRVDGGYIQIGNTTNSSDDANALLKSLPFADGAAYNAYERGNETCLDGTRVEVLNNIMEWAAAHDSRCVYWISGLAGTGKSTIARTIAKRHAEAGQLGASFFFVRGGGDLASARKFVATIAVQLAEAVPALTQHIARAVSGTRNITALTLQDQWMRLVREPLAKLHSAGSGGGGGGERRRSDRKPLLLVVDALEECDRDRDLGAILGLLTTAADEKEQWLRVLLTSRPETPVQYRIMNIPESSRQHLVLHRIDPPVVDNDIFHFFRANLRPIGAKYLGDPAWPDNDLLLRLVKQTGGLFIWAATACQHITLAKIFADRRLQHLLKGPGSETACEKKLDAIYDMVLQEAITGDYDEEERQELLIHTRSILGTISVLRAPLDAISLLSVIPTTHSIFHKTVQGLRSVMDIPEEPRRPIQLHHASFRDFILNPMRNISLSCGVDSKMQNKLLADRCICLMREHLRRDVCDLKKPGMQIADVKPGLVEQRLPAAISYACSYWVHHVREAGTSYVDFNNILNFLKKHILHWLEALCLLERPGEAVYLLRDLKVVVTDTVPELEAFVYDAQRFVLAHRGIIEKAPLQLYCSALVFSPMNSFVRQQCAGELFSGIIRSPKISNTWNCLLQVLEPPYREAKFTSELDHLPHTPDHESRAFAFSPMGDILASADDHRLFLWDTTSGTLYGSSTDDVSPFPSDSSYTITTITFSSDGQQIACCRSIQYHESRLRLFDTALMTQRGAIPCGKASADTVALSPTGELLAFASNYADRGLFNPLNDGTIELWDTDSITVREKLVTGNFVFQLSFSPNGRVLAYTTVEHIVLRDYLTRSTVAIIRDAYASVFSLTGELFAYTSTDKCVKLFDVGRATVHNTWKGDRLNHAVVFSRDGRLIASYGREGPCTIWKVSSGVPLNTIGLDGWSFVHLAFSPNGRLLVGKMINVLSVHASLACVWDMQSGSIRGTYDIDGKNSDGIAFSHDGELLAISSKGNCIDLRDTALIGNPGVQVGSHLYIDETLFAPDGHQVAFTLSDGTLHVWNVLTDGTCHSSAWPLVNDCTIQRTLQFSPNGRQLVVLAKSDYTFETSLGLLDVQSEKYTLLDIKVRGFSSVAFSPDCNLLVMYDYKRSTFRLWDICRGTYHCTIRNSSSDIDCVGLSLGQTLLASAAADHIYLYDIGSRNIVQKLDLRFTHVNNLAISHVSKYLAVSHDSTYLAPPGVTLFDCARGCTLWELNLRNQTRHLSFSADRLDIHTDHDFIAVDVPRDGIQWLTKAQTPKVVVRDGWITYNGRKILWIPHEYRPRRLHVHENSIALTNLDAQPTILTIEPAQLENGEYGAAPHDNQHGLHLETVTQRVRQVAWTGRSSGSAFLSG